MVSFRSVIYVLYMMVTLPVYAQIQDDFSDGDFSNNPTWITSDGSGTGSDFQVTAGELRSKGPTASATLWASTYNPTYFGSGTTTWTFEARYLNPPSGSNYARIYLVADTVDLTLAQGYYIQLGESGSDDGIDLFRTGQSTPIISDLNPTVASGIDHVIRVTRSGMGVWTLEAKVTGTNDFTLIGSSSDVGILQGDVTGILISHTSTRNQDFYFDNISVNTEDLGPPNVLDVRIISSTELEVLFSEEIQELSAELVTNYTLAGVGMPILAELNTQDNTVVTLTFEQELINGTTYQLDITGVADLNENIIVSDSIEFFYFMKEPVAYGDIIVSEILADPVPANDLPEKEFVELFNVSTKPFNLAGWVFSDAASQVVLTEHYILSGEYVILCALADVSYFEQYGRVLGVSRLPSLNNSGDQLTLKDELGLLVDSVSYSNSWYQDANKAEGGWSLERIDPVNPCNDARNWIASIDSRGGTPGTINSVYNENADQIPPRVLEINVVDDQHLRFKVDEPFDLASLSEAVFKIDQGVEVSDQSPVTGVEIELELSSTLTPNIPYHLSIEGLMDCSGNSTDTSDAIPFIFIVGSPASPKDVVINEIFADPLPRNDLPEGEFIELYNRSNKVIDLANWSIADATSETVISTGALFPGDFLILCPKEMQDEFVPFGKVLGIENWPSLNNTGDAIVIKDTNRNIIDSVFYQESWYRSTTKREGGWTLELIDPDNTCSEEDNWIASEDSTGGTPGKENSVFNQNPDLNGPQLQQALALTPDSLLLIFNEKLDEESIRTIQVRIQPDINIGEIRINNVTRTLAIKPVDPFQAGQAYEVTVTGLRDCSGNMVDPNYNKLIFRLIEKGLPGDVVINEILFNPRPSGIDFVELYNKSGKYLSLKEWILANGILDNDTVRANSKTRISAEHLVLEPGAFLVLTTDALQLKDQYPLGHEDRFLELSSLPSYPDAEGHVILLDENENNIDVVSYVEDWHSPLINNSEGISLERVSVDSPANLADNWKSASSASGYATPGYVNTSSRQVASTSETITIDPKIVIPGSVGKYAFATIGYKFDMPGNVGSLRIVDIQGRPVKEIANNDLLSTEGFFTWDGTHDDGEPARLGYYIVLMEVFDVYGNVNVIKEKIVVGSSF